MKWNDFQANVTKSFGLLRREKNLFDVTLVSDSEEHIPAHRLVLSACSDFFKNIFKKVDNHNPLIYLAGVRSEDIKMILNYMYHGEVQVYKKELNNFLEVAEKLKIDGLMVTKEEKDFFRENPQKDFFEELSGDTSLVEETNVLTNKGEIALSVDNSTYEEAKRAVEKLKIDGLMVTKEGTDFFREKPQKDLFEGGVEKGVRTEEVSFVEVEIKTEETTIVEEEVKTVKKNKNASLSNKREIAFSVDNPTNEEAKKAVDELVYKEGDLWLCKSCKMSAKKSSQIRKHAELHIEGLSFPCPLCDDSFRSRQRLADHKRYQHK